MAFNKTSFDNEVPPSEGSVKIQQLEINNGVSKTRLFGHRKI